MRFAWWTALPMLLAAPVPAFAQDAEPSAADAAPAPPPAAQEQAIDFSAATVSYDSESELITASGAVRMARDGNYLAADKVVWDRRTGEVRAEGNVVVLNPAGDKLVGERVVLTDSLRDGTIENLLVVLESGGRIAATHGTRQGDVTTLDNAIYSPCPVTSASGCPRRPSWSITAARVIYDPTRNQVRFRGGRLQLFGIDLPLLPVFAIGTGGGNSGANGWLIPDINVSSRNGFEIAAPYYRRLAPNRDLTVTPHLYSATYPAIEARYRELNRLGAFQLGGFATYGSISDSDFEDDNPDDRHGFRLYLDGNGKAQLNPLWSVTGAFRVASDKTLTRRFDITRDDRLRSFVNAERIDSHSYISIAGWAFQGLRVDDVQKQFPIALPAIDARWRMAGPVVGGDIELQANSLAILRIDGQDTQRAFTSARWDLRRLTAWGQQLLFTALVRGDVYHTQDSDQTNVAIYRGTDGWHARGIAALAADAQWPLIGPLFGGIQRLVPRAQLVLTPPTPNLNIPNEDARAVDLEDSNLFALNRFPGYDRWEDGSRLTLGVDWFFDRPNLSIATTIGQSFRISKHAGIFPEGTGLTGRVSDIVGRSRVRYGRLIDLTHRFRIDKDDFSVRRNEIDLTIGSEQTYAQVGYLKLNRDISAAVEDLRDREELRFAGRVKVARYWSLFGATVLDLTGGDEDPLSLADGFEPVRHRFGVTYEDECLELGLSWRRDYERIGSFRKGSTFSLRLSLKGLGR